VKFPLNWNRAFVAYLEGGGGGGGDDDGVDDEKSMKTALS
jgi:hypothetical protein